MAPPLPPLSPLARSPQAKIEASYASIVPHTPEYAKARDQYAKVKMELNALSAARAIELGQINAARCVPQCQCRLARTLRRRPPSRMRALRQRGLLAAWV